MAPDGDPGRAAAPRNRANFDNQSSSRPLSAAAQARLATQQQQEEETQRSENPPRRSIQLDASEERAFLDYLDSHIWEAAQGSEADDEEREQSRLRCVTDLLKVTVKLESEINHYGQKLKLVFSNLIRTLNMLSINFNAPIEGQARADRASNMINQNAMWVMARRIQDQLDRLQIVIMRNPGIAGTCRADLVGSLRNISQGVATEFRPFVEARVNEELMIEDNRRAVSRYNEQVTARDTLWKQHKAVFVDHIADLEEAAPHLAAFEDAEGDEDKLEAAEAIVLVLRRTIDDHMAGMKSWAEEDTSFINSLQNYGSLFGPMDPLYSRSNAADRFHTPTGPRQGRAAYASTPSSSGGPRGGGNAGRGGGNSGRGGGMAGRGGRGAGVGLARHIPTGNSTINNSPGYATNQYGSLSSTHSTPPARPHPSHAMVPYGGINNGQGSNSQRGPNSQHPQQAQNNYLRAVHQPQHSPGAAHDGHDARQQSPANLSGPATTSPQGSTGPSSPAPGRQHGNINNRQMVLARRDSIVSGSHTMAGRDSDTTASGAASPRTGTPSVGSAPSVSLSLALLPQHDDLPPDLADIRDMFDNFYNSIREWISNFYADEESGPVDLDALEAESPALYGALLAAYSPLTKVESRAYLKTHMVDGTLVERSCLLSRVLVDYFVNRIFVVGSWLGINATVDKDLAELARDFNIVKAGPADVRQAVIDSMARLINKIPTMQGFTEYRVRKINTVMKLMTNLLRPMLSQNADMRSLRNQFAHVIVHGWNLSARILTSGVTYDFHFPRCGIRFLTNTMAPVIPNVTPAKLQADYWRIALVITPVVTIRDERDNKTSVYVVSLADVICMQ